MNDFQNGVCLVQEYGKRKGINFYILQFHM